MKKTQHGFYSHHNALVFGWSVYLTPEGKEVTVTRVCATKDCDGNVPDQKYVGPVVKYVKGEHYENPRLLPPDLDDASKEALAWATEEWIKEYRILAEGMKLTVESLYWEVRLGFLPRSPEDQNGFDRSRAEEIVGRVCFSHQMGCGFPSVVPYLNGKEMTQLDELTFRLATMFG